MNLKVKICQGCRKSLLKRTSLREILFPPYDICISRKEQRPFFDKTIGDMRTPSRETDSHYHLTPIAYVLLRKLLILILFAYRNTLRLTTFIKKKSKRNFMLIFIDAFLDVRFTKF